MGRIIGRYRAKQWPYPLTPETTRAHYLPNFLPMLPILRNVAQATDFIMSAPCPRKPTSSPAI